MKFSRRTDLDAQTRVEIIKAGIRAKGTYGGMIGLAHQYNISRSFLYQLMAMAMFCLTEMLSIQSREEINPHQMDVNQLIVLLRLEGKCSISSISEILKTLNYPHSSEGMISQLLKKYGGALSPTLSADGKYLVIFLSDEIFALGCPILVTIEPKSTAILKIELASNCSADTWQNHYEELELNQFIAKALASDRGKGITSGFKAAHPQSPWYSDHFHEFMELFKLLKKFEKQADAAIDYKNDRWCKLNNARSESNIKKRREQYEQAAQVCLEKIELYKQVEAALQLLIPSLYFITSFGHPNDKQTVKDDILTIMGWLEEMEDEQISKETESIRNHIDDIILCYHQVEEVYQELLTQIDEDILSALCTAWQHQHLSNQTKGDSKHYHQAESKFWVNYAETFLGSQAESAIKQVFDSLDEMVRSSSLIEMVNSRIRPYLNSCKGQITQEALNLIMFFHNHRPYKSNKRKESAPIEILTQTKLDKHWIESLFDTLTPINT